jgi:NAD(P)-dependent dehydrogenase (short-subunit alcohol dehydrogenase family)
MSRYPLAAFDLSGKVALVTGGSRGLGKEMVLAFARCGADVAISSRKLEACEALAQQVRGETGREALAIACHVGKWEECDALVDAVSAQFGRVDVLVNNAGMSPLYESLSGVSEDLWDKVMNVNLRGPFRLSSLIGERMAAGAGGSILNVSSEALAQPGSLRRSQGRAQQPDHRTREQLRSQGSCELHPARAVPYGHLESLDACSARRLREVAAARARRRGR